MVPLFGATPDGGLTVAFGVVQLLLLIGGVLAVLRLRRRARERDRDGATSRIAAAYRESDDEES